MGPRAAVDAWHAASGVALGQAISLLVAGTGVFSTLLAQRGISLPTAQSSLNYYLLAIVYGTRRAAAARRERALSWLESLQAAFAPSAPWWHYALLALCDVEANFFVVKAYAFTSVTSIMLIDCWTIVVVMALSARFLGRRFGRAHIGGVLCCVAGLVVLAVSDAAAGPASGSDGGGGGGVNATLAGTLDGPQLAALLLAPLRPARGAAATSLRSSDDGSGSGSGSGGGLGPLLSGALYGDLLCVIAASLYGLSNVGQEMLVKAHDTSEYLALLGLYGSVLNTVQAAVLERGKLAAVLASAPSDRGAVVGLVLGFAGCLFAMYSLTAVFLQRCDSTVFNLALLTSDAWAVLAALFLFGQRIGPLYWPALLLIVAGLVLYHRAAPPGERAPPLAARMVTAAGESAEELVDDRPYAPSPGPPLAAGPGAGGPLAAAPG